MIDYICESKFTIINGCLCNYLQPQESAEDVTSAASGVGIVHRQRSLRSRRSIATVK
jgi:hypothetical protein